MSSTHILVLGATSAIAQAYARRRAAEGARFVLVGRQPDHLATVGADLLARGAGAADAVAFDLAEVGQIASRARQLRDQFGEPSEIVVAYGRLGDQSESEQDIEAAKTVLDTNFNSAALWLLAFLKDRSPSLSLTVIGVLSGAGDRGRARNFIYGAAKSGFNCFLEGMQHKYAGSMVHVLRVKPGLVDSPMTASLEKDSLLWSTPERVATDIHRAVLRRRRVVYSPWYWRFIMLMIRFLPWPIFRRLKV